VRSDFHPAAGSREGDALTGARRRRAWAYRVSGALAIAAVAAACSTSSPGPAAGLEVFITTNLENPAEYDAIQVEVSQQLPAGTWNTVFNLPQKVPEEVKLPTHLAIAAGTSPDQDALIKVTALRGYSGVGTGTAAVVSIAQVQIPTNRVAELTMELSTTCIGVECSENESCQPSTGMCHGDTISGTLPTYDADASYVDVGVASLDGGGPTPEGGGIHMGTQDVGSDDVGSPPETGTPISDDAAPPPPEEAGPTDTGAMDTGHPPPPPEEADGGDCSAGSVVFFATDPGTDNTAGSFGNFNTTGPVCVKLLGGITTQYGGWEGENMAGRTLILNGASNATTAGEQGVVPAGADGYAIWEWSAGTASYAGMNFY
jgi:hypothetical protein